MAGAVGSPSADAARHTALTDLLVDDGAPLRDRPPYSWSVMPLTGPAPTPAGTPAPGPTRAPRPAGDAGRLLADYRDGSVWFSADRRHHLGTGTRRELSSAEGIGPGLSASTTSALRHDRDHGGPGIALGALPFGPGTPAALRIPDTVHRAAGTVGNVTAGLPADLVDLVPHPGEADYAHAVATALLRLRAEDDDLRKVVLSRTLRARTPAPVDVRVLLTRLLSADPDAFVYAVDLPRDPARDEPGGGPRTLVGASPELLLARHGDTVTACPLAGSAPRCEDPAEDARRARALLSSAKDLTEHAVVADAVRGALAPWCRDLDVPAVPELRSSATLWHLATPVTGVLASSSTTSLDLLAALHPTPAVCGVPVDAARRLIGDLEPFDRRYFTGAVGWCDADGDGEWAVTIRCAEVHDRTVTLFAGAGIVAASDPDAEVAETAAKFRTSLAALGVGA